MILDFFKMQGAGNDFIVIYEPGGECRIDENTVKRISERRFSIGSDGVIAVCASETADFKMKMFNSDGSVGTMCGNGIRCAAKFVYDRGITRKKRLLAETDSGIKELVLSNEGDVTVSMGEYTFLGSEDGKTRISVGNAHQVSFTDDLDGIEEPHSTEYNLEFVKALSRDSFSARVFERGCGETYSCGTGACAVAAAACERGMADFGRENGIIFKGGTLYVTVGNDKTVLLRGNAVNVYRGSIVL